LYIPHGGSGGVAGDVLPPLPYKDPGDLAKAKANLGIADSDTQGFQVSAEKKFRTGISTKLQYDLGRKDPVGISNTVPDYYYGTTSRGKVGLTITVPLLKGAWETSAGAAEKAAGFEYQSAAAKYKHLITSTLLGTVNAYWNYTAAYEILHQRILIKERVEKLMSANHLNGFLDGFLKEKQGNVVTATQQVEVSRIALAKVMGISTEDAKKLGMPDAANFPKDPEKLLASFDTKKAREEWVELALINRNDLRANKLSLEANDTLLAKDQQDLYPELTAAVGLGYNGISHGNGFDNYVDSTYRNVRDIDNNASLTFSYPLGNDAAEGVYDQDKARKMINTVTMNETARTIKLSVENTVATVSGRLKIVIQAKQTRDAYRDSLLDLFKKANLKSAEEVAGLVVLQQKLEDAIVAYVGAQADFSNAIAQARFEAGVLISNAENSDLNADINMEKVASLPSLVAN
jgi:outer membrane protein TolC